MEITEIPLYNNEREFEKSFAEQARWLKGWEYIKIPDLIPVRTKAGNYYVPTAHKRPFDGILCTRRNNIAVELKYKSGRLKAHQRKILEQISELNEQAMVIRYRPQKGFVVEYYQDGVWEKSFDFPDYNSLFDWIDEVF